MPIALPVESKAFRFAPAIDGQPVSHFWKVWAEGAEVYLSSRTPSGGTHFSFHQSGEAHHRVAAKEKRSIAPLMRLESGPWMHAMEIRFLLALESLRPVRQPPNPKRKKTYIVPVPAGYVFHANLLLGDAELASDSPLPSGFMPAAQILWRTRLRDSRLAVLIGRWLEITDENRRQLQYIHEELKPTATYSAMPTGDKHAEIHLINWSPHGGNVLLVAPLGDEAFRAEDEAVSAFDQLQPRPFSVEAESAEVTILAPDMRAVVNIRLSGIHQSLELTKGRPLRAVLGHLTLDLVTSNLVAGGRFIASPCRLSHMVKIGSAYPRSWSYSVAAKFDGLAMTIELRPSSVALFPNANLVGSVHGLRDNEELTLTSPDDVLTFKLTPTEPNSSSDLIGRLLLRDRR